IFSLVFVEVIRLAIVLLATAAGYSVGHGPGDEQVIAAVLGACVGYVAGGVLGRLVRRAMGQVEQQVRDMPGPRLFAGILGGVAKAGFLSAALLVPRFVFDELQSIADAAEPTRRRRGRRGLEVLDSLRELPGCTVHVIDDEVPGFEDVDAKLIALARRLGASL